MIRISYWSNFKIDEINTVEFNDHFRSTSAEDFFSKYLLEGNVKYLIVGKDFKFGKDRLGNFKILEHYSKENNFNVHLVESLTPFDSSDKFSSSIIRENIKNGEMEKANFALGRHWHMTGLIVKGDKRARKINFPTANVLPGNHIIPRKGVYCIEAYVKNQKYLGEVNKKITK